MFFMKKSLNYLFNFHIIVYNKNNKKPLNVLEPLAESLLL